MPGKNGADSSSAVPKSADKSGKKPKAETDTTANIEKQMKRKKSNVPLGLFWIKNLIKDFVSHKYFPDSMLSVFTILSVAIAFPFYPLVLLIPFLIITFILARIHPFVGLIALVFITIPMFIYQTPLLAWVLLILVSIAFITGFKHYRTITLAYALVTLPFSYLGFFLEIPAFMFGVLYIGLRRGLIMALLTIILIPVLSNLTGVQTTAPIAFNNQLLQYVLSTPKYSQILIPINSAPGMGKFLSASAQALSRFFSPSVAQFIFNGFNLALQSISYNSELILIQIGIWFITIFTISTYTIKSRSPYKGTESSIFSFIMLGGYLLLMYLLKATINWNVLIGFAVAPPLLFAFELSDIEVVRTLQVMKQDFLEIFGEVFEELTPGTKETLDDVSNYEQTKKEIREALIAPIDHREIVGAYHIHPPKGILLFGPPGTGKTLLMRALSNEIRARFFYVKTSAIMSQYSAQTINTISKIFDNAKKHSPSVLFFDEIDGIAGKRESEESETNKQMLSTLMSEMDGFQKVEGVVIVGSTNVPQMLDTGILRPGRFDKIIYMPLPDYNGRVEMFKYYAKKYPTSPDLDCEKLAKITSRFSGADIANVCAEAARNIAEVALEQVKVLKVETDDIAKVIKATKPSTSMSQIAQYEKFKLDYERRMYPERMHESTERITMNDVAGLKEAKKALREAETPILYPEEIQKYDVKGLAGILLFGPPGTGKSMMMRAVENEIGEIKLIKISGEEISKAYSQKGISAIKEVFDRAEENAPAIVFIDEIDSVVPNREKATEIGVQLTAEFLREFDAIKEIKGVIVVGATNRPESIDNAILHPGRFDKLVYVGPPDKDDRERIFKLNLHKAPLADDFSFDKLASITEGYTGADITNICRQAKVNALQLSLETKEDVKLSTSDVEKIIKATKPSAPSNVLNRYKEFMDEYNRT